MRVSCEWDPIEGGIEPSKPIERFRHPARLPSGILRCAHRATSRPLSNGCRTSTRIYVLVAPRERRCLPTEGSTTLPILPLSERMNEGRKIKSGNTLIDPRREGIGGFVTPGLGLNRINRRLIPTSCNFFSRSTYLKYSKVKRAWPIEI